ncbi:MAG: ribonuclease HII [Pseudomonadota bacterium]
MIHPLDHSGPDFQLEHNAITRYGLPVIGVDEAGRGPWAGPVVAAAVILDPQNIPDGLNDSKKLSPKKRDDLFQVLHNCAQIGVGICDVRRIDQINILQATLWAMQQAVKQLQICSSFVLVDGNVSPQLGGMVQTIIKGDSRSYSIAAASIIAKVTRDRIMIELDAEFPDYGWAQNKGYGTKQHRNAMEQFGITCHHRVSYKPVRKFMHV